MGAQSLTSFCCFFAAAWLVSHNWPLNVWYSVVIEHFGLQRAAQRSCTKFTASVVLKTAKSAWILHQDQKRLSLLYLITESCFCPVLRGIETSNGKWFRLQQVPDACGTTFKERQHKLGLQLHQLFHHFLRKYSLTQANPKAYCQQINYGFTQLVHKLRCVQGKMIVPPNDLSPQCLSLVWNVPLRDVCWRLPLPVCVDRRSAGRWPDLFNYSISPTHLSMSSLVWFSSGRPPV